MAWGLLGYKHAVLHHAAADGMMPSPVGAIDP
jgi:hypothetical protein